MRTLALAAFLPLLFASGTRAAEAASDFQPCNVNETPELKGADYTFEVNIVSGTHAGKTFRGAFTLPPLNPGITGNIELVDFRFCYAGKLHDMSHFDPLYGSKPRATVKAGKLVRLECCGGTVTLRFGFTNGFERDQFQRSHEDFVRSGEDYFGYLNPETFVDGVGRITYRQVEAK